MKAYLNAPEVAKLLHVDRATVSRWLQKGMIPRAIRLKGKQQWRIPLSAYEELVRRQEQYESH
jgi:excisionase family DNA binding protein